MSCVQPSPYRCMATVSRPFQFKEVMDVITYANVITDSKPVCLDCAERLCDIEVTNGAYIP